MKHCYTLLLLIWCSLASAQTDFRFADSTAQWNVLESEYYFFGGGGQFTFSYLVGNDSVVNGYSYQSILCMSGSGLFLYQDSIMLIRRDSLGRVYRRFHSDTSDMLIYDFSKGKGDTVVLLVPQLVYFGGLVCSVDSTDSIVIGHSRKRMFITYSGSGWNSDVWIEGIGSTKSIWISPGWERGAVDGPSYSLLCFSESNILRYQADGFNTCFVDTSWSSVENASVLPTKVYFTGESILVELESAGLGMCFSLYDLTGRILLQKQLTEQTARVDVSNIARGVYVYSIQSAGQKIKTGKLMME